MKVEGRERGEGNRRGMNGRILFLSTSEEERRGKRGPSP